MRILWQNYFMLFQLDNVAETNIEIIQYTPKVTNKTLSATIYLAL